MFFSALNFITKPKNLPTTETNQATLQKVLTILFVTLGAVALLMIVLAGIRYIFSKGEPEKVAQAKNMILYSIIGLVIAASATVVVNLAINQATS